MTDAIQNNQADRMIYYLLAYFIAAAVLFPESQYHGQETTLEADGFVVFHFLSGSLSGSPQASLQQATLQRLPPDYEFLDYEYTIRGTSLSTWHRDVTSGQSYHQTKYPTYTAIHYLYDGAHLSVAPGSHRTFPFTWTGPKHIDGANGTVVLFNADLLHAGRPNRIGAARHAVQYKIAHSYDLAALRHLDRTIITKIGDPDDDIPFWVHKMSFHWSWLTSTVLASLLQQRYAAGSFAGALQSLIPIQFYNQGSAAPGPV